MLFSVCLTDVSGHSVWAKLGQCSGDKTIQGSVFPERLCW